MIAIKWAYRHGALVASPHSSLNSALASASRASDDGDEALHSLEVIDDSSVTLYEGDAAYDLMYAYQDREVDSPPQGPAVIVEVQGDNGTWAHLSAFGSLTNADAMVTALAPLGDRVRTRP